MPTPLNIAVIGLAHLHPRSYMALFKAVPALRVAAVMEPDPALRLPFCNEFSLPGYATLPALLAAEKLDVAAIFLPHADCPPAAAACAARGLHLMVEKPAAASAAGARKIAAAARKHKVLLTTGYVWRFHPVAHEIKQLVSAGSIGRVVAAEGRCAAGRLQRYVDGHAPWVLQKSRSGGGPMYNLGVHWIDLFRWLLDDQVTHVSARNVKVNTRYDVEDNSFAHLQFSQGAIAALDISYTVPDAFPHGRDLYLSLRGTKGVLSWAPAYEGQQDELFICSDHPDFQGSPRVRRQYNLTPTPGYSGYMGLAYVQNFVDSILHKHPPHVTPQDAIAALDVVEAVYRSAATNRWTPVPRR